MCLRSIEQSAILRRLTRWHRFHAQGVHSGNRRCCPPLRVQAHGQRALRRWQPRPDHRRPGRNDRVSSRRSCSYTATVRLGSGADGSFDARGAHRGVHSPVGSRRPHEDRSPRNDDVDGGATQGPPALGRHPDHGGADGHEAAARRRHRRHRTRHRAGGRAAAPPRHPPVRLGHEFRCAVRRSQGRSRHGCRIGRDGNLLGGRRHASRRAAGQQPILLRTGQCPVRLPRRTPVVHPSLPLQGRPGREDRNGRTPARVEERRQDC